MNSNTQSVPWLRLPVGIRQGGLYLALGALCAVASAQTWDGSSNSNWSTSANWTPASVPGYGATVNFDDTPGSNQTINVGGNRQIAEVNLSSSYDYVFNSGAFVFVTGSREFNFSGTGNLTVNSNIIGSGGAILLNNNSSAIMQINGGVSQWSSTSVHFTGSGTTVMNGSIAYMPVTVSGTGNRTFNTSISNAGLTIDAGTNTFNNSVGGGNITISGGDNAFNSDIGSATLNISGGTNFFDGAFGGGTTFNMTGGDAIVTDGFGGGSSINVNVTAGGLSVQGAIGGGANIDVQSGQLALSGAVGSGAAVSIASGGTLLLEDGADLSGGGSNVTLNGGTLAVSADEVFIANLTLNEDSTIDMLNDADADIDFGNISGDAIVNIVNYNSTDQVYFNPSGSSINVSTQVFFDGAPGMIDPGDPNRIIPGATPVPEPETVIVGILLLLVLGGHGWIRFRRNAVPAVATV